MHAPARARAGRSKEGRRAPRRLLGRAQRGAVVLPLFVVVFAAPPSLCGPRRPYDRADKRRSADGRTVARPSPAPGHGEEARAAGKTEGRRSSSLAQFFAPRATRSIVGGVRAARAADQHTYPMVKLLFARTKNKRGRGRGDDPKGREGVQGGGGEGEEGVRRRGRRRRRRRRRLRRRALASCCCSLNAALHAHSPRRREAIGNDTSRCKKSWLCACPPSPKT
jgi:hypothetical protein